MMMKKVYVFFIMILFLSSKADACVGKMLTIGVVESNLVLGEILSSIINERTGTTTAVKIFRSEQELYQAVQMKKVDISVENTTSAMRALKKPVEGDATRIYEIVKEAYEKEKGLIWLKPFGFLHPDRQASPSYTAPVLRLEVLNNFPALPRVIGKLAYSLDDETHARLIKAVESGEQPKKAARDFLKSKKLI